MNNKGIKTIELPHWSKTILKNIDTEQETKKHREETIETLKEMRDMMMNDDKKQKG